MGPQLSQRRSTIVDINQRLLELQRDDVSTLESQSTTQRLEQHFGEGEDEMMMVIDDDPAQVRNAAPSTLDEIPRRCSKPARYSEDGGELQRHYLKIELLGA